jgi:hypothetical protein
MRHPSLKSKPKHSRSHTKAKNTTAAMTNRTTPTPRKIDIPQSTTRYGLVIDPIVIGQDYILGGYGSLGGTVLQADGQWTDWLPDNESQVNKSGFDPIYCASEGTTNALEILTRRLYGLHRNWSARFLAKASDTTPSGNSPHKTAETARKVGLPNEIDWPFTDDIKTWTEFYKDIPQAIYSLAVAFLNEFDFKHEYVVPQPFYLKQALQYSPVGISVYAWVKGTDGLYYKPQGAQDNHWVVLVGYVEAQYWLIYDSYEPQELKKVKWDTQFQVAKRYSLNRQVANEKSWGQFLIDLVLAAFGLNKPKPVQLDIDHTEPTPQPAPAPKYLWDTPSNAKHSVRLICDEEGLTVEQKDTMTATIQGESGFNLKAVNYNKRNGKVVSTDFGLCQWNDYYHGKEISPDEALNNPEKAVRLMCAYWKRGQRDLWIAYKSGAYKKYL